MISHGGGKYEYNISFSFRKHQLYLNKKYNIIALLTDL